MLSRHPSPFKAPLPQRYLARVLQCLLAIILPLVAPALSADSPLKGTAPNRVVSLNLCTDELLLSVADPRQIVSVTWLSQDPSQSAFAEHAAAYQGNRGLLEEILQLQPDLVLAGPFGSAYVMQFLAQQNIPVARFELALSLTDIMDNVERLGHLLGRNKYAQQLNHNLRDRLSQIQQRSTDANDGQPIAAVYDANGFTAGAQTLADDILSAAGFTNYAVHHGFGLFDRLPLEQLVVYPPDLLIINQHDTQQPSLAQELTTHPVLRARAGTTLAVAAKRWACGTPSVIEVVEQLNRWRSQLISQSPQAS